jgi:hypothetical protein
MDEIPPFCRHRHVTYWPRMNLYSCDACGAILDIEDLYPKDEK